MPGGSGGEGAPARRDLMALFELGSEDRFQSPVPQRAGSAPLSTQLLTPLTVSTEATEYPDTVLTVDGASGTGKQSAAKPAATEAPCKMPPGHPTFWTTESLTRLPTAVARIVPHVAGDGGVTPSWDG